MASSSHRPVPHTARRPVWLHERDVTEIQRPGRVVHPFVGREDGARLLSAGVVTFPAHSESIPHAHTDEEEVLFVLAGRGALVCDGDPIPLEPGSFVFVPPGIEHFVRVEGDEAIRFFYTFSPPVVIGTW